MALIPDAAVLHSSPIARHIIVFYNMCIFLLHRRVVITL